jgi:hypothetical protein
MPSPFLFFPAAAAFDAVIRVGGGIVRRAAPFEQEFGASFPGLVPPDRRQSGDLGDEARMSGVELHVRAGVHQPHERHDRPRDVVVAREESQDFFAFFVGHGVRLVYCNLVSVTSRKRARRGARCHCTRMGLW